MTLLHHRLGIKDFKNFGGDFKYHPNGDTTCHEWVELHDGTLKEDTYITKCRSDRLPHNRSLPATGYGFSCRDDLDRAGLETDGGKWIIARNRMTYTEYVKWCEGNKWKPMKVDKYFCLIDN